MHEMICNPKYTHAFILHMIPMIKGLDFASIRFFD